MNAILSRTWVTENIVGQSNPFTLSTQVGPCPGVFPDVLESFAMILLRDFGGFISGYPISTLEP